MPIALRFASRTRLFFETLFSICRVSFKRRPLVSLVLALILGIILPVIGLFTIRIAQANNTAQTLPFSQDWTNIALITVDDDWSGVPGVIGYRGDGLTSGTAVNPQTVVAESTVVDVNANQTSPNTFATGGVSEFHIPNPVVALQGSGTARAPYIQLHLNTIAKSSINVAYNLRDIDGSTDNAVQPVALQFRVGSTGNFTNVPAGFVADATTGPSLATLVTPVSATLPAAADNQPLVQVRIITTDAVGSDEWVGIDDIVVTGSGVVVPTNPTGVGQATPNTIVAGGSTLLTVVVTPGANPVSTGLAVTADLSSIDGSNAQMFFDNGTNGDVTSGDNIFSYNATTLVTTTPGAKTLPFTVSDAQLRSSGGSISLTVQAPPPPSNHVVISQIYGGGGNALATYQNDYVELYNPSPTTFNLNGWSVQYAAATGSGWASGTVPLGGPIAPGEYYLVKLGTNGAVGLVLPQANAEGTVNMAAGSGKIALVNNSDGLSGATAACPLEDPNLVDFVGYGGTANCREGTANAPAGTNSTAVLRNGNGAVDTNQNGDDFTAGAPNPRRTAIILDAPPTVSSTDLDSDPFDTTPGAPRDGSVAVFFSENVEVTGNWYDLTCANTGPHTAVVSAGPRNWVITADANFLPGEVCTFQIFAANVKDSDLDDSQPNTDFMQANYSTNFTVATGAAPVPTPDVHLTMGNPSGAITDINQPNNYLLVKPELALSYNKAKGEPNWVSWHLSDDWTGSLTRVDTFRPDPALPSSWFRANQFSYTGSGFDRGHMTPSADRLKSLPINQATFLMDNIIPQAPDNNQQTWNNMEQALRTYTPANELYIISGGAGVGGSGDNGFATTIANGNITVPAFTWKVALVIPKGDNDISRVDCSSRTIAVIVPNTNGTNTDWTTYLTTVDAVETLTGYDFFSNLPEPVQRCVEAGINGNNPPLDTDADGVPDSTDNCDFVANPDQANFDNDSMGDACDPDDDNDGQSDADEIACGSNPYNAASKATDTDGDNQPDCVDTDDDNDGVPDATDNCPLTANADQADGDGDGIGNACDPNPNDGPTGDLDGDGVLNNVDNCPNTPNADQLNTDGDAQGNACDSDDDNDGVPDATDNCPLVANADQADGDGDGIGNVCDSNLNDGPTGDLDGDGVPNNVDNCPTTPNPDQLNTDGDSQGNACDSDDDNDGVPDATDNCPLVANADQADGDGDGIGNVCDPNPNDGPTGDLDGDGVLNNVDNCPTTSNPDQLDSDGDHIGNACDADDDGDGIPDATDNCPLTANSNQADFDHDGLGDACDPDDDNDGVADGADQCPNTPPNTQVNAAGCPDADGDGIANSSDNCPTTYNPDQRDTNGDGIGDACTAFQLPSGGVFVIGDQVSLSNGSTVYFWGSQWSQNNPMSGGSAPNVFKGFEDGSAPPACGGTWTTSPGNSSNPPPTVPQYMAVIVSSSVQKNGSVLSGDIKKIIIVRTNPGYGPSAGQPGTGQVVAILCGTTNQSASLLYRLLDSPASSESFAGFQWLGERGSGNESSGFLRGALR